MTTATRLPIHSLMLVCRQLYLDTRASVARSVVFIFDRARSFEHFLLKAQAIHAHVRHAILLFSVFVNWGERTATGKSASFAGHPSLKDAQTMRRLVLQSKLRHLLSCTVLVRQIPAMPATTFMANMAKCYSDMALLFPIGMAEGGFIHFKHYYDRPGQDRTLARVQPLGSDEDSMNAAAQELAKHNTDGK